MVRIVAIVCVALLLETAAPLAQESGRLDRAFRITGTYENGKIVSLEAMPLEVRLPLSVTERVTDATPPDGFFLQLLDGNETSLLRLRIEDPSFVLMEYEDPDEPGRIVSKEIHVAKAEFSMLIPAPPESRSLRFMKVAPGQETFAADERRSDDLGTFVLPQSGAGPAMRVGEGGER
jgi:hypothetical protein